jgi:hypothetical protein
MSVERRSNSMTAFKKSALAACVGVLGLAVVPATRADVWNKKTILTVNESIQLPNKVLEPGKYVMKLMDSPSNRHIVQVFNEDESQLITTVLALPNYRLQPTGETRFTFWETVSGEPKPLRSWFYPGDNFGQEFAYPKNKATMIARASGENVPTTYSTSESDLATARVGAVNPEGVEGELDKETYTKPAEVAESQTPTEAAPQPQTEAATQPQTQAQVETPRQTPEAQVQTEMPRQTAQARQTEMPQQTAQTDSEASRQAQTDTTSDRLPDTASPLPLIGLAGLLSISAGAAVRALARR